MTKRLLRVITVSMLLAILTACSSEDPNPELKDPIYKDLLSEYGKHKKMLEDAEKNMITVEQELAAVDIRSIDRKIKSREYQKLMKDIVKLREMTEFYRIKSELRKVYGRKAYRIAFRENKEWPNPKEFENYNINKKLRDAPRNWSHRVPKAQHQEISEEQKKKGK